MFSQVSRRLHLSPWIKQKNQEIREFYSQRSNSSHPPNLKGAKSEFTGQTEWPAHLLLGWWTVTSGPQAPVLPRTLGNSSPQHMRKMCALSMTLGSVCSETCDQHKIVNATTVDHKNMSRRTQTQILTLLRRWTWMIWRNATHRTPKNPSLVMLQKLFPPVFLELYHQSLSSRKSALLATQKVSIFSLDHICNVFLFWFWNSSMEFWSIFSFFENHALLWTGWCWPASSQLDTKDCSLKNICLQLYDLGRNTKGLTFLVCFGMIV